MALPNKFNVSGTPEQLGVVLPLLEGIWLGLQNLEVGGNSVNRPPIDPDFDDYLMLTTVWQGKIVGTGKNHQLDKSVRLKLINPRTVSLDRLQLLARNVVAKLNTITYKTGYCKVKYASYKAGIRTWGYFDTKESGYRIIESICDLVDHPLNKKKLKYEYLFDDSEARDTTPNRIQLANHSVRPDDPMPIATMRFYRAMLLFPWIGHVEKLCDNKGYIIPSLDFLKAYE